MNLALVGAIVAFAAWIVLAFVVAWPSGWAHAPLAIGIVLLAKAIVDAAERQEGGR